ncbi:MAG: signal peptide peptidase SppA [Thermodesulfobacteriota bacterium]|nr:signal peptide peptidase SppA [Thermodesulfobacteriota bacterium]
MFSRRHPFLFFILVLSAIVFGSATVISVVAGLYSGKPAFESGEKVGIVEVKGVILSSEQVIEDLKMFREDDAIRAVVVRIDSPGGAVGPAQEIYREIHKTAETKNVVASMGSVAASGGYYVASATEKIFANPGTLTGSIGVIMSYTNFQELMDKLGLLPVVIKSGQYKDIGSPVRHLEEKEKQILQEFADDIHRQFIDDVAAGRNMEAGAVAKLADGRIYTGRKALELGLVDELGNLEDAAETAGRMAGIKGDIVQVYPERKTKFSLAELLTGASAQELANALIHGQAVSAGYLYRPGL